MNLTDRELALKSIQYRKRVLEIIHHAGAGHTGGSLSCLDILNVLYNRVLRVSPEKFSDPGRDRYVQSKGHSVEALYVVLADRGFFPGGNWKRSANTNPISSAIPPKKSPASNKTPGRWDTAYLSASARPSPPKKTAAISGSLYCSGTAN